MDRKSRVRIGHARRANVTSQTIAKYVLFSTKCRKHQKRSIGILDLILISVKKLNQFLTMCKGHRNIG
jgi:hypothetical protein